MKKKRRLRKEIKELLLLIVIHLLVINTTLVLFTGSLLYVVLYVAACLVLYIYNYDLVNKVLDKLIWKVDWKHLTYTIIYGNI